MCSVLACACGLASTGWAAEVADKKAEAHDTAAHERKLDEARKRLDEAAREIAELSRQISEETMPQVAHIMRREASRAMLGVTVGDRARQKRKDGVEITSVSPGGPAAEAGLKAGDVIVELNGKALEQDGSEAPLEKLLSEMRELEPDEKVKVRYLRDGKPASATIVARRMESIFPIPPRPPGFEHAPTFAFMRSRGLFGSAELVALTPKLGQYFGTEKGLLVVRPPDDSRLKLEEGDVIVDIDGRVPTSVSHAVRIFASYQPGEKLKLNVLRMKKPLTFDITMPEDVLEYRFDLPKVRGFDGFVISPMAPPPPPAPPAPASSNGDTA